MSSIRFDNTVTLVMSKEEAAGLLYILSTSCAGEGFWIHMEDLLRVLEVVDKGKSPIERSPGQAPTQFNSR